MSWLYFAAVAVGVAWCAVRIHRAGRELDRALRRIRAQTEAELNSRCLASQLPEHIEEEMLEELRADIEEYGVEWFGRER